MAFIIPFIDRMEKVNLQIITMPVPAQEGITRDNVTVRVDAAIYFKVVDPLKAAVDVEDYTLAVGQVAQTSLRSIIGKSELDDLLTNRERLNEGLEVMIDSPAVDWGGVHIDRVEIKDVALPESMKRSMSRQAEAERERTARIINADAELQASGKLSRAAAVMAETPAALQLRLLQTVTAVAAEKNSTLVLPFPVELLRFLERSTPGNDRDETSRREDASRRADAPADSEAATQEGSGETASDWVRQEELETTEREALADAGAQTLLGSPRFERIAGMPAQPTETATSAAPIAEPEPEPTPGR